MSGKEHLELITWVNFSFSAIRELVSKALYNLTVRDPMTMAKQGTSCRVSTLAQTLYEFTELTIYRYILYKMESFIDFSAINKSDNLTCAIIYDNCTCDDYR